MQLKKSLGQNFLKSESAINKIIEASNITAEDTILEIGPGEGVLTEKLLLYGGKVIAVEKDYRLIPTLSEKFKKEIEANKLILIEGDILEIEDEDLKINGDYKIIANIPYYITGQIIRKFLEKDDKPKSMTLLVQKEVAERVVAKDGKESLLSLSVKIFGEPKYIKTVSKGSFKPQPKVDSAILYIGNIGNNKINKDRLNNFFKVIHAGFAHKRKQLLPNLSSILDKEKLAVIFKELGIGEKSRAEDLSLETWILICNRIFS